MKQVDISGITALTKDRNTSIRLYRQYKRKHPNQHPQWVVQKVIYDLDRDRRTITVANKLVRTRTSRLKGKPVIGKPMRPLAWVVVAAIALTAVSKLQNGRPVIDSGWNNLEPPSLYRQIESGSAVTIQNEVPEPVKVTLRDLETDVKYSYSLPAYPKGRYYPSSETLPEGCSEDAPVRSLPVQPGTYKATIQYVGTTRTETGSWTIVDGWEHFGCYYSVHHDNDD